MTAPAARLGSDLPIPSGTPGYSKLPEKVSVIPKDKFIHSSVPVLPKKMAVSKGPPSIFLRTVRGSVGTAKPASPKPAASKPTPSLPKVPKDEAGSPGSPTVLIPLPETPVESVEPRESLHRPREEQKRMPTATEALLEPDFVPAGQPGRTKEEHQPWSLKGGWQPKEEDPPPPPKVRGEKQAAPATGPILGELPPRLMGGPDRSGVQFSMGEPVRTYKDEEGVEVTEYKQPGDPTESWLATVEIKTRIVDGVERKVAGQIRLDPAKIEEEAAGALDPKEI